MFRLEYHVAAMMASNCPRMSFAPDRWQDTIAAAMGSR
jgi:hypothetical protein